MAHSLVREQSQLLTDLAHGKFNLTLLVNTKTGEREARLRWSYLPRKAFESFAARLRHSSCKESVYWELVLDALKELSDETFGRCHRHRRFT